MVSALKESSRQASGFVKLGGMCCTTTMGGSGGDNPAKSCAKAGGPPVEMPIATQRSVSSRAAAFVVSVGGGLTIGASPTRDLRSFRIARIFFTSAPAAIRILRGSSSINTARVLAP